MHTSRDPSACDQASAFALSASELRALAHRLVDDYCDGLQGLREEPVWRAVPPAVRAALRTPLPREPLGLERAYAEFRRDVLPYRYGNVHPRFFGWVNGSALPAGVLADFLASAMNSNVGAFDQGAVYVEEQVLSWLTGIFGFPAETDGILTSGGSVANLLALAAALAAHAPSDARERGLVAAGRRYTLYGSSETHSSVHKAVEILGLGRENFRTLPVDAHYRVDPAAVERAVRADRAQGLVPFALVGNAGTVNTGATDPLPELAALARREGLWLHVDGAFGALAWLCPERRNELAGLDQVDSLAFDLHKWMYLPSDVGCVLVRHRAGLQRAFSTTAPYLAHLSGGLSAVTEGAFKDRGIELTRRFRALKVWFALKVHGSAAFERAIRANLNQARHLVGRIACEPRLELLAPAPLNVVNFRYRTAAQAGEPRRNAALGNALTNSLNQELLVRLQEGGVAVPSQTLLDGRFALRVAITNHRTELADLDLMLDEVLRLGDQLERESTGGRAPSWISPTPKAASKT